MLLLKNIRSLIHTEDKPALKIAGSKMNELTKVDGAYLLIHGGRIEDFGIQTNERLKEIHEQYPDLQELDVKNRLVFPSFCDPHTHLVWAGNRAGEFQDRLNGLTYEEIALKGGGILNSAERLRKASESELLEAAELRLQEIIRTGTGAVEIKSGYGLDKDSELKILRVIRKIRERSPIAVKSTFLGAHAVPNEYRSDKNAYLDLIIDKMLPEIADEKLADYCDIFVEKNYFTEEEALRLFEAAGQYGLIPKVHAEQLSHSGGIRAGVRSKAISVDHLEFASEEDIELLKNSETMPVLLPGAQLFLGLQNPPARKMIASGCAVAIASDYNPGSCPSGNMHQMMSLGSILYKLTPSEALIASTTNSAYAMGLSMTHGSIAKGKTANLFIAPAHYESHAFLPYHFGNNPAETIIINGKVI